MLRMFSAACSPPQCVCSSTASRASKLEGALWGDMSYDRKARIASRKRRHLSVWTTYLAIEQQSDLESYSHSLTDLS